MKNLNGLLYFAFLVFLAFSGNSEVAAKSLSESEIAKERDYVESKFLLPKEPPRVTGLSSKSVTLLKTRQSDFKEIRYPGAYVTEAEGMNDNGDVVGRYVLQVPGEPTVRRGSFLYRNGIYTNITYLGWDTFLKKINNSGKIAGYAYNTPFLRRAITYQNGSFEVGAFQTFSSIFTGINDVGQVVGEYQSGDDTLTFSGINGIYSSLPPYQFESSGIYEIRLRDINNLGLGLGRWGSISSRGLYLYSAGNYAELNDFTEAWGINDSGDIVGTGVVEGEFRSIIKKNGTVFQFAYPLENNYPTLIDINNTGHVLGVVQNLDYPNSPVLLTSFIYVPSAPVPPTVSPITLAKSQTPDGRSGNANCFLCPVGAPVNIANGALWHENTEFSIPGRTPETGLSFERSYTAIDAVGAGDLGPNWHHKFESAIYASGENLIWIDEKGGAWTFFAQSQRDTFQAPPGLNATLNRFSDRIELRKSNGTIYTYSVRGQLQSITDRHGESLTLTYDLAGFLKSVSSPLAGTMSFTRNSTGRIESVTRERDDLTYTFEYNQDGRLAQVKDFNNLTYTYSYVTGMPETPAQGMLASITDPLDRTIEFTYYPDGRAYQQFEPGGGVRTFVYGNRRTDVTEVDGYTSRYFFDENLNLTIEVLPDGAKKYSKWENGRVVGAKSEHGGSTKYSYDSNGNLSSILGPENSSPLEITYDQAFNVPIHLEPTEGADTQFTLNPLNGDVLQISRNGLSLTFTRDTFGNVLSINNGQTTYANHRNADGLLVNIFDLHNPETRTYDDRARVSTRSFQSGRLVSYTYDDYDRVIQITDSHGPSIANSYDAMGKLLVRTLSAGSTSQITSYSYDDRDRLTSVKDATDRMTTDLTPKI